MFELGRFNRIIIIFLPVLVRTWEGWAHVTSESPRSYFLGLVTDLTVTCPLRASVDSPFP